MGVNPEYIFPTQLVTTSHWSYEYVKKNKQGETETASHMQHMRNNW